MKYRNTATAAAKGREDKPYTDEMASRPVVTVDYEKYAHFLEDAELSEAQKREFLQTLWNIIVGFVDLGFGVHPAQQAQNPCGQLAENLSLSAISQADKVKWPDRLLIEKFEEATEPQNEPEEEGVGS